VATNVISIPTIPNPKRGDAEEYKARNGRPMLFSVTSPSNVTEVLYPVFLALHISPNSIKERMVKGKNVVMTYGGFVEFVWPDDLNALSCSSSTGAFLNPEGGLVGASDAPTTDGRFSTGRRNSIAWERQEDFLELFRNNGCVFNGQGQPILRGRVVCLYDRGMFVGHFSSFEVQENGDNPFTFNLSWEFKVEQTIYKVPNQTSGSGNISRSLGRDDEEGGLA